MRNSPPVAGILLASLLSPLTSGCVAAVIPLAAGTVMVRHQVAENRAAQAAPPATGTATGTALANAVAASEIKIVRTTLTALPPPDPPPGLARSNVADFGAYALQTARAAPGQRPPESALLAGASELRPARIACGARPPAVFVDLDPGRETFDPLAPGTAAPDLAAVLAQLREREIKVVWFSRLGENFAPAARAALTAGGLDPAGADALVLMRDIAERKQSRRDEIAAQWCPVAMLGDERADFDELYHYLKNPGEAIALDALIGRGWFLASPFTPIAATAALPTPP